MNTDTDSTRCGFDPDTAREEWWPYDVETEDQPLLDDSCDRSALDGHDRCIWHIYEEGKDASTIEDALERSENPPAFAYLSNTDLKDVELSGKVFRYANFTNANLVDADVSKTKFEKSDLSWANFTGKNLRRVDFTHSKLHASQFERSWLSYVDFTGSDLKRATFVQSNFRTEVKFEDARLQDVVLTGALADEAVIEGYNSALAADGKWLAAAKDYRRWADVADNSSLPEIQRNLYVEYKHAKRLSYDFCSLKRMFAGGSRWILYYGESPWRVLIVSALVIGGVVPLYLLTEGIRTTERVVTPAPANAFEYLYFSVVTFSSLGYGDYYPVDVAAKVIVMGQTLVGALLIALVIFVLGRRTTQ